MSASAAFWAEHQVGGPYETVEESEAALAARAEMFPNLEALMPTKWPGAVVLDYGCGPGHDTLLFLRGGARHVTYADFSALALRTTQKRLALHYDPPSASGRMLGLVAAPRAFAHVVHCAGVLHHVAEPVVVLGELRDALRPGGHVQLMVYDGEKSPHTQSAVPITHWWSRDEVRSLAAEAGLRAEYLGSYECAATWRPDAWAACYRLEEA